MMERNPKFTKSVKKKIFKLRLSHINSYEINLCRCLSTTITLNSDGYEEKEKQNLFRETMGKWRGRCSAINIEVEGIADAKPVRFLIFSLYFFHWETLTLYAN